jgi:hypothetical protein
MPEVSTGTNAKHLTATHHILERMITAQPNVLEQYEKYGIVTTQILHSIENTVRALVTIPLQYWIDLIPWLRITASSINSLSHASFTVSKPWPDDLLSATQIEQHPDTWKEQVIIALISSTIVNCGNEKISDLYMQYMSKESYNELVRGMLDSMHAMQTSFVKYPMGASLYINVVHVCGTLFVQNPSEQLSTIDTCDIQAISSDLGELMKKALRLNMQMVDTMHYFEWIQPYLNHALTPSMVNEIVTSANIDYFTNSNEEAFCNQLNTQLFNKPDCTIINHLMQAIRGYFIYGDEETFCHQLCKSSTRSIES